MADRDGAQRSKNKSKAKINALQDQLCELQSQLDTVQTEVDSLESSNRSLLCQAQEREAELERERAKLARLMMHSNGQRGAIDNGEHAANSGADEDMTPGSSKPERSATGAAGNNNNNAPVVSIRLSGGAVIEVSKDLLDAPAPRRQLEQIMGVVFQELRDGARRIDELDSAIKGTFLNVPVNNGGAAAELKERRASEIQHLASLVQSCVSLYAHAFKSDPVDTASMSERLASQRPEQTSWQGVQRQLRMTDEQQSRLAQSVQQYVSVVKRCMDRRKELQGRLQVRTAVLLEWESVSQWLMTEAAVNELQTTLVREVDSYLDWCRYVCTNIWTPPQAAQFLPMFSLRDLLRVCCALVQPQPQQGSMAPTSAALAPPSSSHHIPQHLQQPLPHHHQQPQQPPQQQHHHGFNSNNTNNMTTMLEPQANDFVGRGWSDTLKVLGSMESNSTGGAHHLPFGAGDQSGSGSAHHIRAPPPAFPQ